MLADVMTASTGVSLGLILAVGSGLVVGIVSRVTHNLAITHLKVAVTGLTECTQKHSKQVAKLETDQKIRDAVGEKQTELARAIASAVGENQTDLAREIASILSESGDHPARSGTRSWSPTKTSRG